MAQLRPILPTAMLAAVPIALVGCSSGSEEFPDDTARVELSDRRHELETISCGLDEEEGVFVLAAEATDSFLQLLLVIDGDEVDTAASALSFESRDTGVVAAGDAALLDAEPGGPGEIVAATIRGDRVDVEADVRTLGTVGESVDRDRLDLVARCAGAGEVAADIDRPGTK